MESNSANQPVANPLLEEVAEKLKSIFNQDILSAEQLYDYPVITVTRERLHDIIKFMYNDLGYIYLTSLCGMHFPDQKNRELGVVYQLHNLRENKRVRIKIYFDIKDATAPTITDIYMGANWLERETYDFFGIDFKGHPNMKRILNMDTLIGWPMRKEFPLEDQTREDKDDTMFGRG